MPYDTISGSKMANNMVSFHNFIIFEKLSLCLPKDLCEKVSKIKNMRYTFPSFFHADFHDIFLFAICNRIWSKIGIENGPFSYFFKI